ncbi:MAG: oxidative damage protection protein [Porticoccaceae bacterium]|nr:oxidative damage protection protein [Porticoccaceae bacterium]
MARTVFCRKLKQDLPGLDQPPFPGPAGEDIFNNISREAWQQWLNHQTMLINEKRLNMMDLTARTYLNEQRERFLSGESYDQAEGYVPPSK